MTQFTQLEYHGLKVAIHLFLGCPKHAAQTIADCLIAYPEPHTFPAAIPPASLCAKIYQAQLAMKENDYVGALTRKGRQLQMSQPAACRLMTDLTAEFGGPYTPGE